VTTPPFLKGGREGFNLVKVFLIIALFYPINPKSMTIGTPMKKLMNGTENIVVEMCIRLLSILH
jgi:hypothetical protein